MNNVPKDKVPGLENFTDEFYQMFMKKLSLSLGQFSTSSSRKSKRESFLPPFMRPALPWKQS